MADRVLLAWAEYDRARAVHGVDIEAIRVLDPARSLVLELLRDPLVTRDLFNACARLGALMAEAGASPTLAAGTIDNAIHALAERDAPCDPSRVAAARASLIEGFIAVVRDVERSVSRDRWEYPACAIALEDGAVAIACGFPLEDGDALAGWASRVAARLAREGVKRVVLSGPEAAKAEIVSAASLVGIAIGPRPRSWLPWRR